MNVKQFFGGFAIGIAVSAAAGVITYFVAGNNFIKNGNSVDSSGYIKYSKEKRKAVEEDQNENINNLKLDTCEDTLEQYVHYLNQWNYTMICKMSHVKDSGFSGSQYFFDEMEGRVTASKFIKGTDKYKLAELKIKIDKPGVSNAKKGEITKYVYIAKNLDEWCVSPMFDKAGDIEEPEYKEDGISLCYWDECLNGGYGFKNEDDYYKSGVHFSKSISVDLNNDGEMDTITLSEPYYSIYSDETESYKTVTFNLDEVDAVGGDPYKSCYLTYDFTINKDQDYELGQKIDYYEDMDIKYYVCDLNSKDNFKELIFKEWIDNEYSEHNHYRYYIWRYSGTDLEQIATIDCNEPELLRKVKGDGKINVDKSFVIANDTVSKNVSYTVSDEGIWMEEQWLTCNSCKYINIQDVYVYSKADKNSDKDVLNKFSNFTIEKYKNETWYKQT
ncbi:MAG: hypothetical protein K6G26_00680, partial [Lachnospiraceae bacterium]|nr:hypothetical protein [Lachnospiraceae bacterium]